MILTPEFRPWVVPFEVTGDRIHDACFDALSTDTAGFNGLLPPPAPKEPNRHSEPDWKSPVLSVLVIFKKIFGNIFGKTLKTRFSICF